jgi:hypothetical protein
MIWTNGILADTVFSGMVHLHGMQSSADWTLDEGHNLEGRRWNWNQSMVWSTNRYLCRVVVPTGSWNTQRLQQYFFPVNVADIMKIRPSMRGNVDFIAWQPDKRGTFSERSMYRLALEDMCGQYLGTTSGQPADHCRWWFGAAWYSDTSQS